MGNAYSSNLKLLVMTRMLFKYESRFFTTSSELQPLLILDVSC